MTRLKLSLLLVLGCALMLGCGEEPKASTPKVSGPTVVIAVPKSGPLGELGRDTERAARMEFERQAGSQTLRQLKLATLNESGSGVEFSDAGQVAEETQTFVDTGMVVGMVGGIDSDALAVELPRLNEAGIAAVSPAATATPFNQRDPAFPGAPLKYYPAFAKFGLSFARTAPTDLGLIGPCLADLAASGTKRVFTIDSGDTDGDSLSSAVEAKAPDFGAVLVGHESVPRGNADWQGVVKQIAASGADAVIWGSAAGTGEAELWKEIQTSGLRTRMMLGPASSPSLLKTLSTVKGGTVVCSAAVPAAVQTEESSALAGRFRSRWGHNPTPGSLRGAAAMAVLLSAIERGASGLLTASNLEPARQGISKAISTTRSVDSAVGPIRLDNLGNWSEAPMGVWNLSGGALSFRQLR